MTSFEDWAMLTWSLGCTGFFEPFSPPSSSMARLEITSLAFMLVEVPEPVWKMSSGKWSSSRPPATSSAARTIASASLPSRLPMAALTAADSRLIAPRAAMKRRGKRRPETGKLRRARSDWAPQYASAATSISPSESFSVRAALIRHLPRARWPPPECIRSRRRAGRPGRDPVRLLLRFGYPTRGTRRSHGLLRALRQRLRQGVPSRDGRPDPHLRQLRVRDPGAGAHLRSLSVPHHRPRHRVRRRLLLLRPLRHAERRARRRGPRGPDRRRQALSAGLESRP